MFIFAFIYLCALALFEVARSRPALFIHLLMAATYCVGALIAYRSSHRPFVAVYLTCGALYLAQCVL